MRIGEHVQVRPKEALAPYVGTVVALGDGLVDVRSADGSARTHPAAQCEAVGGEADEHARLRAFLDLTSVSLVASPMPAALAAAVDETPVAPVKKPRAPRKPRKAVK